MMALVVLAVYAVLGLLGVVLVLVRRPEGPLAARLGQALLALVLWPFLLPVLLSPGAPPARAEPPVRSERARQLEEAARQLEESWRQAAVESVWAAEQAREHRLLEGFLTRLRAQERRMAELEATLASAPASVKERLGRLHEHSAADLQHSIGLMVELTAQLTLLRFADVGEPSTTRLEREHIQQLLLRFEALAEASQPASHGQPHGA